MAITISQATLIEATQLATELWPHLPPIVGRAKALKSIQSRQQPSVTVTQQPRSLVTTSTPTIPSAARLRIEVDKRARAILAANPDMRPFVARQKALRCVRVEMPQLV
jgi:hypothetical protein